MSTTAEKLMLLLNTKATIKAALVEKGQEVSDVFSTYADMIRAIPSKITASSDGDGNVTLMMVGNTADETEYDTILIADSSTSDIYGLYVTAGKLTMAEIVTIDDPLNNPVYDNIPIIDRSTSKTYIIYAMDGKLIMEESDSVGDSICDDIIITDRLTSKTYIIYAMDGKLIMEESEA